MKASAHYICKLYKFDLMFLRFQGRSDRKVLIPFNKLQFIYAKTCIQITHKQTKNKNKNKKITKSKNKTKTKCNSKNITKTMQFNQMKCEDVRLLTINPTFTNQCIF